MFGLLARVQRLVDHVDVDHDVDHVDEIAVIFRNVFQLKTLQTAKIFKKNMSSEKNEPKKKKRKSTQVENILKR